MFIANMNQPPKGESAMLYGDGYPDYTARVPLQYSPTMLVSFEETEAYQKFIEKMFDRQELFLYACTPDEKFEKLRVTEILKKVGMEIPAHYDLSVDRTGPEYMFMFALFHDDGFGDLLIGSDEEVIHALPNKQQYRDVSGYVRPEIFYWLMKEN